MIDRAATHAQLVRMCVDLQASIDADMDLHSQLCMARDAAAPTVGEVMRLILKECGPTTDPNAPDGVLSVTESASAITSDRGPTLMNERTP